MSAMCSVCVCSVQCVRSDLCAVYSVLRTVQCAVCSVQGVCVGGQRRVAGGHFSNLSMNGLALSLQSNTLTLKCVLHLFCTLMCCKIHLIHCTLSLQSNTLTLKCTTLVCSTLVLYRVHLCALWYTLFTKTEMLKLRNCQLHTFADYFEIEVAHHFLCALV